MEPESSMRNGDTKGSEKDNFRVTRDRVVLLVSSLEIVELNDFKSLYREKFGDDYICPAGKEHCLRKCLKQHFYELYLFGNNARKKISLSQDIVLKTANDNQELSNEQNPSNDAEYVDVKFAKEDLVEVAKQRLLKLVSLGPVHLEYSPLYYRQLYKEDYTCPLGSKHGLKSCVRVHLSRYIETYGKKLGKKIRARQDQILKTEGGIQEPTNKQKPSTDAEYLDVESLKEGVIEAAKQRLLKLVSLGPVDLVYAPLYYRKLYKEDYTCPLGSKHGLKSCLKGHLSSHIEIYGQNPEKKIRAKQDQILKTGGDIRELSNNQKPSNDAECVDLESFKEDVIGVAKQRLLKLVSLGPVDLEYAPLYYRELYKEDYTCPLGRKHSLKACMKAHLFRYIETYGKKPEQKIRARHNQDLKTEEDIKEPTDKKEFPMDPNEKLAEQERLVNATWLRVKQLLNIQGPLDNESFTSLYRTYFDVDYCCPLKIDHSLVTCLKKHFSQIRVTSPNGKKCISLTTDAGLRPTSASRVLASAEHAAEFPSLAEGATLPQAPKHSRKESRQPKAVKSVPLKAFLEKNPNHSTGRQAGRYNSSIPKASEHLSQTAVAVTAQPVQYNQFPSNTAFSHAAYSSHTSAIQPVQHFQFPVQAMTLNYQNGHFVPHPGAQPIQYNQFPVENTASNYYTGHSSQQSAAGVAISSNGKSAAYTYDIEGQPSKTLPSVDDVNQRVTHYRTSIAKAGQYVDVNGICRQLCEYYRVRSVRELRCSDRKQGFCKESDIPAIKEFSMTANKVLCSIQAYCTSSTIATLYDLENFICDLASKKSFSELKLGPLQKFPLVWHYFRVPHDRQISELTPADIIHYLWNYGRGKKRIDLKEFLQHIAEKRDFKSPYDMGVLVNSIALAISITRKVKFGDRLKLNDAEKKLIQSIEEDLEDHLKKLRRGLTGGRNQRLVQDENVIAKVAGMHIEDCIDEIFKFANDMRMQLQQQIGAFGFLGALQRIMETMMFFRSKPVWAKLFHVILATCTFRKIGYDDQKILEVLGFRDSLKKLTDDQMMERFGSDGERIMGSEFRNTSKMKINPGKLLKSTVNWLQNSKKPLDVKTLGTIEQKVAQHFGGPSFDSLGAGPFLSFIQKKEVRHHLGKSILVSTEEENELHELLVIKEDIKLFVEQCGDENSHPKNHIIQSIRRQFKCTKKWSNSQILSILDDTSSTTTLEPECITFIHAMDCGADESCLSNIDPSDGSKINESLGSFTREQAIACLKSAPILENLATWSCWEAVFAPDFGDLKSFLKNCKEVYAIEAPSQELLRISLDSTVNDLRDAILVEGPQEVAGHLLSIIKVNDGLDNSPVNRMANVMKSSLSEKLVEHLREFISIERFVLECMLHIPIQFCSSIAQKIFLNPLHDLLGDDYGRDPIPARILRACVSTAERSFLHSLGAVLAIKEWKEDFKQFCFVSHEHDRKNAYLKNAVREKVKEPPSNNTIDVHRANIKDVSHDKEPYEQNIDKEEMTRKGDSLMELAEDSNEQPESVSDEEHSSDLATSIEDVVELDEEEEPEVNEAEERMNQCKELIEKIRQEEFGIGEYVDEKGKARQEKNNERLCRALDRLSKELYAKDTHFVLELIQNADDNIYDDVLMEEESEEKPSVAFIVDENRVTILNNEHGFEDNNIKAICDIGKSTKGKHKKGYIGQKGIGFKSIFRVTDCPEVHSNGFHICFDAREDKMGYILPTWHDNYTDYFNYSPHNGNLLINWVTQIDLPLKKSMTMSDKARSVFQNIHPSLLLFLNRLQTLIIENKIDGKSIVMNRRSKGKNIVELTQNGLPSTWFVFTKEISISVREEDEVKATDISLAFPLDDVISANLKLQALPPQNVHAFLPLRSYGFKFILQADFEVPSSREDIDKDSPWNQEVLKDIPQIVVDAFLQFLTTLSDDSMPSSALLRATKFFQFLPLESEIHGVFKPIARKILQYMQQVECIPVVKSDNMALEAESLDVGWTKPSQVLLGDSLLRKIVSPTDLKQYLDLSYMNDAMQQNVNPALLKALGVHAESLDTLLEIGISHIKTISEQTDKDELTVNWIGNWLLCVSQHLEREYDSSSSSLQKIGRSIVFPLSNGKLVNLTGQAVFFPFKKNTKKDVRGSADDYIVTLEEDLNTIDARIFNDMDQIGELRLERFLADLGVKKMSPIDVIESHIIPCLKSGKWAEKDHLVVPYLMYIKEHYFKDSSSIDFEALKQCVIISTSHGSVRPTEKQIYFTPRFGVKWCLLSSKYIKGSSTVKLWQQFFRKLGVIDFPKTRKNRLTFDRSEMNNSPWAGLIGNWRKTGDGAYHINDLSCPEFEEVLDSEDHDQLCRLALQLDSKWKSNFHHLNCVTVEDSQGNKVATTLSSFLIKLQTATWLPGEVDQQQNRLFKPNELYLKATEVYSILDVFGHYCIPDLKDETFIDAIKIRNSITVETVFERLNEWSRDGTFCTSLCHMTNVYSFIQKRMNEVDPSELNMPLIFVPSKTSTSPDKFYGKFQERGEVCLHDPSGVMMKRETLLRNKRTLLDKFYPKDILYFFKMDLKIDATPTIRDYMGIACALADDTKLPDAEACRDLMEVFSVIGRKCIPCENEEAFLEMAKYCDDRWSGYQQVAKYISSKNANFVFENLKEEKIFPTNRNKFVSIKEKPLLPDDLNHQKIFEKEERVHLIIIPDMRPNLDEEPKRFSKRDGARGTKKKLKEYEILVFFAVCRIDVISNVVCEPRVLPENIVEGCEKWHRNFSTLLPYAQRYIHENLKDTYRMNVEDNVPQKLRNLTFFTASSIDTVHELKDMDIHVTIQETCFVEYTEENIYYYILHQSLDETEDILSKFVEIFGIQGERNTEELCYLLTLILHSLKDLRRVEKILEKKRIPPLPESEEIWKLKEIPKKERPVQKALKQVPEQHLPPGSNEMTCWPPRAQESLGIFSPRSRTSAENNLPSEWVEPAPPESSLNVTLDSSNTAVPQMQAQVQNLVPAVTYKRENSAQSSTQLPKKVPEKSAANSQNIDNTAVKEKTHKTQTDTRETQGECQERATSNKLPATQWKVDACSIAVDEAAEESQIQSQQIGAAHATAPSHASAPPQNDGLVSSPPRMAADLNVIQGRNVRPVEIQTQNLHYALEKVPHERISDHVTSLVVNPNNADTAVIGRSGEKLVYEALLKVWFKEVDQGDLNVIWVNEDQETGLPYDIQIMRRDNDEYVPVKYIEVKATKEVENKAFEMSPNELRYAFQFGPSYDVYRVGGIGMEESLKIKHLPGFATYLDKSVAKIFIAL